jgi:chromosome segregation ATPase
MSTSSQKSKTAGGVSGMASAQLKNLQKTIEQLKARLEKEMEARTAHSRVLQEAKKAREALATQLASLKQQGTHLTKELKKALGDADKREAARQQALAKVAELRAELGRRTDELKRKSEELGRLAMDSAGRAKDIIMSEAPSASSGGGTTTRSFGSSSEAAETESVSDDTESKEESPKESSIERELHPERKNEPST